MAGRSTKQQQRTGPRPYSEVKAEKRAREAERQRAIDTEHGIVREDAAGEPEE